MITPDAPESSQEDQCAAEIITFYSYKGGTGRTMALANVAGLICQLNPGSKVLVVDWDLEAPGLHWYFLPYVAPVDRDKPGIIDLFCRIREYVKTMDSVPRELTSELSAALRSSIDRKQYLVPTTIPGVKLLKAGCFDDRYPERVSTFPWEPLYEEAPWLFEFVADYLSDGFQYVLIDSRTGITDTSGACTMLLPDKVVMVFTPNHQSLEGVLDISRRALAYRAASNNVRPLSIFPLPSRIEASEPVQLSDWRKRAPDGYQLLFERLFEENLHLENCDLESYFNEIQVQHSSAYAYGEKIAAIVDRSGNRLSLKASYAHFTRRLTAVGEPWENASEQAGISSEKELVTRAEGLLASLDLEQQHAACKLFLQLLTTTENSGAPVAKDVREDWLSQEEKDVAYIFAAAKVLTENAAQQHRSFGIADGRLIQSWPRLRNWFEENADFLDWRRRMQVFLHQWSTGGKHRHGLLKGDVLAEARKWFPRNKQQLNTQEVEFLQLSVRSFQSGKIQRIALSTLLAVLLVGSLLWWRYTSTVGYQINKMISDAETIIPASGSSVPDWVEALVWDRQLTAATDVIRHIPTREERSWAAQRGAVALARFDQVESAVELLQKFVDTDQRLYSSLQLAQELAQSNHLDDAGRMARSILAEAQGIQSRDQTDFVVRVIPVLARAGLADTAFAAAGQIENDRDRISALSLAAIALADSGQAQQAKPFLDKMLSLVARADTADRNRLAYGIIAALIKSGQINETITFAKTLSPDVVGSSLISAADGLAKQGRTPEAVRVASAACTQTWRMRNLVQEDSLLSRCASVFASNQDERETELVLARIVSPLARAMASADAAVIFAKRNNQVAVRKMGLEAVSFLFEGQRLEDYSDAFGSVAIALFEAHLSEQAYALLESVPDSYSRSNYLSDAAMALSERDQAMQLAHKAQKVAQTVGDTKKRSDALARTVLIFVRADDLHEALEVLKTIPDDESRSSALAVVAPALAKAGDYRQARLRAQECIISRDRLMAYAGVLSQYAAHGDERVAAILEQRSQTGGPR